MTDWIHGHVHHRDAELHYYRSPKNALPPLVLCHGFSDNGLCWDRVSQALAADFDIIMIDARNHGLSSSGSVTSEDMIDDLAAVIRALDLGPTAALGHSMGAGTVAGLAAEHPGLVSKIILEDPPWYDIHGADAPTKGSQRVQNFKKFLEMVEKMSDAQLLAFGKTLRPNWQEDDFPAWMQSKRQVNPLALVGLRHSDWQARVKKIKCPTLLIHADNSSDGILKPSVINAVLGSNSRFSTQEIKHSGHNIRRDQFEAYLSTLREFL
ncbi:MAG: alpha/beta fold hydrolase [Pseudomonadales bacterium]